MSPWSSTGDPVSPPRRQPRELYSRHCQPSALPKKALLRQRSQRLWWSGSAVGLLLLGGLIWGVSELGHAPQWVEAQEAQQANPQATQTTPGVWQSASFPIEQFVRYTSPFGYREHPFGGQRFHYGLDFAAPMGSYIRAWWEGEVVEVSDDTACGTSVVIQSDSWLHIYCHLQGYVVVEPDGDRWFVDPDGGLRMRQGDRVPTGKRIGRVGMTGSTTGPHLHWGLKHEGTWVDPALVILAMTEAQSGLPN
ncbi:MAG: M23 family metallopeptidase [Cyanobacteria bacterium J06638_28]